MSSGGPVYIWLLLVACMIQEVWWVARSITLELCHSIYLAISTSADWISLQMNAAWPVYASCWYSCWCWWGPQAWQWCQLLTKDHLRGYSSGADCISGQTWEWNDLKMQNVNCRPSPIIDGRYHLVERSNKNQLRTGAHSVKSICRNGNDLSMFFINTLCIK